MRPFSAIRSRRSGAGFHDEPRPALSFRGSRFADARFARKVGRRVRNLPTQPRGLSDALIPRRGWVDPPFRAKLSVHARYGAALHSG
jgi:hypothetical protein